MLSETDDSDLFKEPDLLEYLNDITEPLLKGNEALMMNVDASIRDANTRKAHNRKK